jgi:hypothetical protein
MKPKRFKPRQQVVCVAKSWRDMTPVHSRDAKSPSFNEIVTVNGYVCWFMGFWAISLEGYQDLYDENDFEPLVEDRVLEKELSEISQPECV